MDGVDPVKDKAILILGADIEFNTMGGEPKKTTYYRFKNQSIKIDSKNGKILILDE